MTSNLSISKDSNENDNQYIWRICSAKDEGILDMSWAEVTDIINNELYPDSDKAYKESAYRKYYQSAKRFYKDVFKPMIGSNALLKQLDQKQIEIEKATKQFQDQRREYKRQLTAQARLEHLYDVIRESAEGLNNQLPLFPLECKASKESGDAEAVLFLSDWHYGMVTKNLYNQYDVEICTLRALELVEKTIVYLQRHKVKTLHVALLGDAVAGAIHVGTRVDAEETVCEQLMRVSEIYAEMIAKFSCYVDEVKVYATYGNHSRTVQKYSDSIHRDNMERIIGWWLKERLEAPDSNIKVYDESEYGELIHIPVCERNIIASHGDLERFKDMGTYFQTIFSQKFGFDVHHVIIGHFHHTESIDRLGIDVAIAPAMCGPDEYAHTKRLYSEPGQLLMMFTPENGCECSYTIRFSI